MVVGTSPANLVGLLMIFPAIFSVLFVWFLRNDRKKQAVLWFLIAVIASGCWGVIAGLRRLILHPQMTIYLDMVLMPVVTLAAVAWFLMTIEYVHQETVHVRYGVYLMAPAAISQILAWTNSSHHLVYASATSVTDQGVLSIDPGPWFLLEQVLYPNVLVLFAIGLLLAEYVTTPSKERRQQIGFLSVGTLILMVSAILWTFGLPPHNLDLFPFGAVGAGAVFIYTIRRYELFKNAPVSRQTAVDEIQDPILFINADGEIADFNPAAKAVFEDVERGTPNQKILSEQGLDITNVEENTKEIETSSGEKHYSIKSHDIAYGRGTAGEAIILRDITAQKKGEQQLKRQNNRLDRFSRVVSHDLRNPLNVASLNLELAREQHDSDYLEKVASAHRRMDTLIEDLLSFAKSDTQTDITESIAMRTLVEESWANVATAQATLVVETNQTIAGNRGQVKQLLENTFRNAVEHCGETVTVTVGSLSDGFYIADDGPGIPPEERSQVFTFGQTTRKDGTGFGLAIVKEIVETHGWHITVTESQHGGARFEITNVEGA